jgi:hypothetical protein
MAVAKGCSAVGGAKMESTLCARLLIGLLSPGMLSLFSEDGTSIRGPIVSFIMLMFDWATGRPSACLARLRLHQQSLQ